MKKLCIIAAPIVYCYITCHVIRVPQGTTPEQLARIAAQGNSLVHWNLVLPKEK